MKRIAVFGVHGAAKTTLVYKLATFYKMENKNVTVIHETARQSPFPINTDVVYQTTIHVVMSQIKKELEAEAQGFEISISDRTPSDAFIYLNKLKRDNEYTRALEIFCLEWVKQYDVLVYLEPTDGFSISSDGIRASDTNYQKIIRDEFRKMVEIIENIEGMQIIKANASQIFDEDLSKKLINKTNRSLYEQSRDLNLV